MESHVSHHSKLKALEWFILMTDVQIFMEETCVLYILIPMGSLTSLTMQALGFVMTNVVCQKVSKISFKSYFLVANVNFDLSSILTKPTASAATGTTTSTTKKSTTTTTIPPKMRTLSVVDFLTSITEEYKEKSTTTTALPPKMRTLSVVEFLTSPPSDEDFTRTQYGKVFAFQLCTQISFWKFNILFELFKCL